MKNRRIAWMILLLFSLSVLTSLAVAAESYSEEDQVAASLRTADLVQPVLLTVGGSPIDVDGFAAPCVGDIDEDGRNDLLVGQLDHGRMRVYRNVSRT